MPKTTAEAQRICPMCKKPQHRDNAGEWIHDTNNYMCEAADFDREGNRRLRLYLWAMGLFILAIVLFQTPIGPLGILVAIAGIVLSVLACKGPWT